MSKRSQNEQKSARLEDVARRAGVSTATVSRVLNRQDSVTPAVRRKVETAVEELGYIPHGAARALASRRSNIIGAVIPTIDNAIFSRCIQTFQERLFDSGFTLLLASSDYDLGREYREVQALVERGIDGLMLIGESHDPRVFELLTAKQVPYVNTWTYSPGGEHPCVGFDNEQAAHQVATYLMDIGHRRFAMIAGITEGNDRALNRARGVKRALEERGMEIPRAHYSERAYEIIEGRKAASYLLAGSNPPSAIICGNDILALGVLFECQARSLAVPGDVSITGFDGIKISGQVEPPLTTMQIPSDEMGRLAAEFLVGRLSGEPVPPHTRLEANLIIRKTTAPPISP